MMYPKTRSTDGWLGYGLMFAALTASFFSIDQLRLMGEPLLSEWLSLETHYYYALIGLLLPFALLLYPFLARRAALTLPLDFVLAGLGSFSAFWLFAHAEPILDEGWEFVAPNDAIAVSVILWVLVLEAVRRVAGLTLFVLVLVFSFYPLVADHMPEMISGMSIGLRETAAYHAMSIESMLGLPFRAFANLVIGFLVFGVALQYTGGGQFFIDFAFSLFGKVRGGPAKVAIISSGLMGSMSGSVITNVLTTGQLTIPAMIKSGFSKKVAAGVEACASTGGVLLPPVMGSTAFVMATFLGVPYIEVAVAAAVPAALYFIALFLQLDAYAAREDLGGVPAAEIPSLGETLKQGWYYIGALALLVWLLLVLQREALAPWAATAALLVVNQFSTRHRFDGPRLKKFLVATGTLLVELLVILCGVGLIVGALSVTGLSGTLINELLFVAGGSIGVLLLMGALTSFVLGIGMTVTAAYIFLAIVLAPALIAGGLNPLAVHLFILYWGMLSFITPPVALGAFAAASIAGAGAIESGFSAMRMGIATYLIPFFFVLAPALVLQGDEPLLPPLIEVLVGTWLIAGGAQGYLSWFGRLESTFCCTIVVVAGVLIALPDLALLGFSDSNLPLNGVGIFAVLACLGIEMAYRSKQRKLTANRASQ
ncbi:MAG: TRAP transporter 4TM/12TM fusion protein [Candidatus Azotimanducaceae bacterium]|jgi:TRAP transporter 4TM/12TM fusion protein